jgi:hypothetical protein
MSVIGHFFHFLFFVSQPQQQPQPLKILSVVSQQTATIIEVSLNNNTLYVLCFGYVLDQGQMLVTGN